jgi:Asp-tRNA(Asn)/Glu-tRNA(Gln) amidotransferase C subunit
VTEIDLGAVARLARVAVDDAGTRALQTALADALRRLAPLRAVQADIRGAAVGVGAGGMPLRADSGPAYAMTRAAAALAPASRLGMVLVPRLGGAAGTRGPRSAEARPDTAAPDMLGDDDLAAELELGA